MLLLQLQLQFGQIQAPLPGIGCATVVAVAVAVAVLADPGPPCRYRGVPGLLLLQLQFWQIQAALGKEEKSWASPGQAQIRPLWLSLCLAWKGRGLPGHSGAVPVNPILFATKSSNINSVVPVMAPVVAVGRT